MAGDVTAEAKHLGAIVKRVVGNAGLLLGGRGMNAVMGLGYMALAGRGLGAASLGLLVMIHAFAQLIGDVMKFQSWQTVLQYGARPLAEGRRADFQRVLRFTLVLDAASTALGLAVAVVGATFFAQKLGWGQAHAAAAGLYMVCILAMVSTTPVGLMRLFNRFDVLALQTMLVSLVRLIGCGIAFVLKAPLEAYLLAWGAGQFVGFGYLLWATLRELQGRNLTTGFAWRGGALTEGMPGAWRFSINTNLSSTLDSVFSHATTLMVGASLGPAAAAFWKVGRQIADAIAKPARLLAPALYPELAKLRAADAEHMMLKVAKQIGLVAGGVGLVLLAASMLAGSSILSLVMGKAFAPAAGVMTWQVAAAVIGIFALPLEPMLISLGRAGQVVAVQAAVSLGYLAMLGAMTRAFSLTGAGASLVIGEACLSLGLLWLLRNHSGAIRLTPAPSPQPQPQPI